MKKIISLLAVFVAVIVLSTSAMAGTSLYSFFGTGGAMAGGFRFDVGPGVLDLSGMYTSAAVGTAPYAVYADYFTWMGGLIGVGASYSNVTGTDVNIQLAPEVALNDKLTVGIGVVLVNYNAPIGGGTGTTSLLPSWGTYFVIPL